MTTIGAKEFRTHLDRYLERAISGEDIIVSHRFKAPVQLSALRKIPVKTNDLSGLKAFDAAVKRPSPFDSTKSIKELYRESIRRKYTS